MILLVPGTQIQIGLAWLQALRFSEFDDLRLLLGLAVSMYCWIS